MSDALTRADFEPFFQAVHEHPPFGWQTRLLTEILERASQGRNDCWPDVVAAPTGAGKTALLDIALFHLAMEAGARTAPRTAPLRVVFAVDRRIIVDQAHARALKLQQALETSDDEPVRKVANALKRFSRRPLHVSELRGGMPRERDWTPSPAQPTILCTTIDQLGSRLLFRGYGVSDSMAPIHAGLLGEDALLLLDEAHLSGAFHDTLDGVARHRRRRDSADLTLPWYACALTATPRQEKSATADAKPAARERRIFSLSVDDRAEPVLAKRLEASKPAALVPVGCDSGKNADAYAQAFVEHAEKLRNDMAVAKRPDPVIAIVVNRVARARDILGTLAAKGHRAILLTGRVRPVQRDELIRTYEHRLRAGRERTGTEGVLFVVATQCVEAGADFDFDALVTEIAPLDGLRQRFGRLNRFGSHKHAPAAILAARDQIAAKANDVLYGDRAKLTWDWLNERLEAEAPKVKRKKGEPEPERMLDFGVNTTDTRLREHPPGDPDSLCAPYKTAPWLRSADLALLSMTNPAPHPDPYLPLFIRGEIDVETDVSIVWRADIDELTEADRRNPEKRRAYEQTCRDVLKLVPPRSGEAMAVPFHAARRWLDQLETGANDFPDADAKETSPDARSDVSDDDRRPAMRWKGPDHDRTELIQSWQLRRGDLIVVPATYGGCDDYGWDAESKTRVRDLADAAALPYWRTKQAVIRLHRDIWAPSPTHVDAEGSTAEESAWSDVAGLIADDANAKELVGGLASLPHLRPELRIASSAFRRFRSTDRSRQLRLRDLNTEDGSSKRLVVIAQKGLGNAIDAAIRDEATNHGALTRMPSLAPSRAADFREGEPVTEDGDEGSLAHRAISLQEHVGDVVLKTNGFCGAVGLEARLHATLAWAAQHHDAGKWDGRFQTFLRLAGRAPVSLDEKSQIPLAKSGRRTRGAETAACKSESSLPPRWRHEIGSVQFAIEALKERDAASQIDAELAVFLIGTHHGFGRPFFKHHDDAEAHARRLGQISIPPGPSPARLDFDWNGADWAELFETLKKRYGVWGLAYLEAVLRLADHRASEEADDRDVIEKADGPAPVPTQEAAE